MNYQQSVFRGYLFITSGSRLVSDVTSLPAAQTQMTALKHHAASLGADLVIAAWDGTPRIRSLDDLANLFEELDATDQSFLFGADEPFIHIDDYSRLFKDAKTEMKWEIWDKLLEYEEHFRDINTRKPISELSPFDKDLIRAGRTPTVTVGREVEDRSVGKRMARKSGEAYIPGAQRGKKPWVISSDD